MEAIDEILEFLHYHPQAKRVDVENCLSKKSSSATIKRILAKGVSDGYIAVEGVGKDAYKAMCDWDGVDCIYNTTPWELHVPIALYAMRTADACACPARTERKRAETENRLKKKMFW